MMKPLVTFMAGAALAAGLVVACSDDSPHGADAATCDCPAAEAPIPNRMMRVRGLDSDLPANSVTNADATCPAGAKLLSGWCDFENMPGTPPQLALVKAGASPLLAETWSCQWQNYNLGTATTHAEAICLMPAQ